MKDATIVLLRPFAWRGVTYLPGDKITLPLPEAQTLENGGAAAIIFIKNRG